MTRNLLGTVRDDQQEFRAYIILKKLAKLWRYPQHFNNKEEIVSYFKFFRSAFCSALFLMGIGVTPFAFGGAYTFTDLNPIGWDGSRASGINNSGQAVITELVASPLTTHAGFWDTSTKTFTNLGFGHASAINNGGQVAGNIYNSGFDFHSAQWSGGTRTELGILGNSSAYAISDSGQVVVYRNSDQHAYLWDTNTDLTTRLDTLGGSSSFASAINSAGQVAGYSHTTANAAQHATVWDTNVNSIADLGTLGGQYSAGLGINNSGQVVGFSYIGEGNPSRNPVYHAAFWNISTSTIADLGTLNGRRNSLAEDVNNAGQVVGVSWTETNQHAFIWNGSTMEDLNALVDSSAAGWSIEHAIAINDDGQIVGNAINKNNLLEEHAFLLTWCESCVPVALIPEPHTYTLMLLTLGLLGITLRQAPT